jgi:hypothetical protein
MPWLVAAEISESLLRADWDEAPGEFPLLTSSSRFGAIAWADNRRLLNCPTQFRLRQV